MLRPGQPTGQPVAADALNPLHVLHQSLDADPTPRFSCHCLAYFVLQGDIIIDIGQHSLQLNEAQLTVFMGLHPFQVTGASCDNRVLQIQLPYSTIFKLNQTPDIQQLLHTGQPFITTLSESLSESIVERWQRDSGHRDPRVVQVVYEEILLYLRRLMLEADSSAMAPAMPLQASHVDRMITAISLDYTNQLKVQDITESAGLEKCYAMKLFKQRIGVSILDYLTLLRLNHAAHLLQTTQAPIIDVAFDSGFSSLTRFYEVFSSRMGISPQAFRKSGNRL